MTSAIRCWLFSAHSACLTTCGFELEALRAKYRQVTTQSKSEWRMESEKKRSPALSCVSSWQSFRVKIVFREMDVLRLLVISRWRGGNSEESNGYELRTQLVDKLTLEADARLVTSRISRMVLTVNWAGKCYSTPTNSPRVPRNSRGEIARGEG